MTKKYGTASQVTGSYAEFQAAVLRALPRDIDPDIAFGWVRNGKSLARILHEALMFDRKSADDPVKVENIYSLTVDYERSVEDGVKAGRYDWSDPHIISANFPTRRKGKGNIKIELIQVECRVASHQLSTDDVISEFDRMRCRPVDPFKLLAFGEKYPDVQRRFQIVALDSPWICREYGYQRKFMCLYGDDSWRGVYLDHLSDDNNDWDKSSRFAAVHK